MIGYLTGGHGQILTKSGPGFGVKSNERQAHDNPPVRVRSGDTPLQCLESGAGRLPNEPQLVLRSRSLMPRLLS